MAGRRGALVTLVLFHCVIFTYQIYHNNNTVLDIVFWSKTIPTYKSTKMFDD